MHFDYFFTFILNYIISIRYAQSDKLKIKEDVPKGKKAKVKNIVLNTSKINL